MTPFTVARAWLDAFNRHDVDALVALYADDATHTSPKIRTLHPDSGGYVSVPAGRAVHLMGDFQRAGGKCETGVKFVPQSGQVYDVINEPRAEHCVVTVMQHDPSALYGLRLDTSTMTAPDLCR